MKDHYEFSNMKGRRNPFIRYLTEPVTMRLDRDTVSWFKAMAEETGIPYQTLINLYLRDCASMTKTADELGYVAPRLSHKKQSA